MSPVRATSSMLTGILLLDGPEWHLCYLKVHTNQVRAIHRRFCIKPRTFDQAKKIVCVNQRSMLCESVLTKLYCIDIASMHNCCVARHGGVCYRGCDGRVAITNISSYGAIGSHQGLGVDCHSHLYCLWILTVFNSLGDVLSSLSDSMRSSVTLSVPKNNLNTACLKVQFVSK